MRILRVFFPVCALAIVTLYFLSSKLTISVGGIQASVDRIEVSKDRLRMVSPKLEGVTDKNGAYKVSADFAEQIPSDPSQVFLTAVRAEVTDASQGWSLMTAPKGKFDTNEEALTLSGDIKVTSSAGITSYLSSAAIDMRGQTVTSDQPVKVTFPEGTLDSRTMRIDMTKSSITFEHDVRVHGQAPPKKDAGTAPANKAAPADKPLALALSRDKPIDIAAPRLTIYDKHKLAHFTGGVITEQAGSRMLSQDLQVFYDGGNAERDAGSGTAPQNNAKLKRIEANGNIRITAADGRNATARQLAYDAANRQLTLDGNVVLVQQGNTLTGSRMIADLGANVTRFPGPGRVKGRFAAREGQPAKPKPGNKPASLLVGGSQLDLSSTRGQPVDVVADTLEVNDKDKLAVFSGDVRTKQGGMKLRSKALKVKYGGGDGEAGGKASVSTIRAVGPVLITTDQKQTATSDWALFDARKQTVTIGGNVVLSQGENVIKGDRLVIDLTTGQSRFENSVDARTGRRPRVKGLFLPRQQLKTGDEPRQAPPPLR